MSLHDTTREAAPLDLGVSRDDTTPRQAESIARTTDVLTKTEIIRSIAPNIAPGTILNNITTTTANINNIVLVSVEITVFVNDGGAGETTLHSDRLLPRPIGVPANRSLASWNIVGPFRSLRDPVSNTFTEGKLNGSVDTDVLIMENQGVVPLDVTYELRIKYIVNRA